MYCPCPVSYTHLDVYKRQALQSRDRHRLHLSGTVGELAVDEVGPIRKDLVEVYLGIFHRIGAPGGEYLGLDYAGIGIFLLELLIFPFCSGRWLEVLSICGMMGVVSLSLIHI